MNIKVVNDKLVQVIKDPEDDAKYQAFIGVYTMLLDSVKVNADTVNIAIDSVDIDQGVNFLDTFAALSKKEAQVAWKTLRNSEKFKANEAYKSLRLMCFFAASGIGGDINTGAMLGNILTAMVFSFKQPKQEVISEDIYPMILTGFVEMLSKEAKFPEWDEVKITPENIQIFANCMEKVLLLPEVQEDASRFPASHALKKWIILGKAYSEEKIELKEREKNKPAKRSNELSQLFEHFKSVEEELDKSIAEATKLTIENRRLEKSLSAVETENREKSKIITSLEKEISELKSEVSQAKEEVDARKKLNDAQVQYREDAQVSLLQDIARALKAEYGDYVETKDMPMNEMLGEIYREKLKKIFKILEQKGVKVES